MTTHDIANPPTHFTGELKDWIYQLLRWLFRVRTQLTVRGSRALRRATQPVRHDLPPGSESSSQALATLFLYSPYQRPYLLHLAESMKAVGNVQVRTYDVLKQRESGFVKRKLNEVRNHGIGFHSFPFHTRQFPGTLHHVLVNHGLDSGKYDGLGSFCFGPGRTLDKNRRRLYDFLLAASPWSLALACDEVPEYRGRVLHCGDWRADAVISAGREPARRRAALDIPAQANVVGIGSTHGRYSTFHRYGNQLFELLAAGGDETVFVIFFHEYERAQQKDLYDALCRYCRQNRRVRIVANEEFEPSLAACDLLISDAGSTSLYYALLGRPMAYLPLDHTSMLPDYPIMTLYPHVHNVDSLMDSAPLIRALHSSSGSLLSPPDWFIERLYPKGSNFADLSQQALRTLFATI